MQISFFDETKVSVEPFSMQLLKWIGNKQRFAHEIISYFPPKYGTYFEPFLGSGAVLATLSPQKAIASDSFLSLIQIFQTLKLSPDQLISWYSDRYQLIAEKGKKDAYETVKSKFNKNPNPADLLFISRACYGGVVRFRKQDGYISTPVGIHDPISVDSFSRRVKEWHSRVQNTDFVHLEYQDAFKKAKRGDLIYCDPPYSDSQAILYGAHSFDLQQLFQVISEAKKKGVYVALSIDGSKKSGEKIIELSVPLKLFEREVFVNVGKSMLKRFQMNGKILNGEHVKDRLLLTY